MGAMLNAAGASRGCADAASDGLDGVDSRSMSTGCAGDGDDTAARTGGLLAVDRVNVVNGESGGATDSRCRAIHMGWWTRTERRRKSEEFARHLRTCCCSNHRQPGDSSGWSRSKRSPSRMGSWRSPRLSRLSESAATGRCPHRWSTKAAGWSAVRPSPVLSLPICLTDVRRVR